MRRIRGGTAALDSSSKAAALLAGAIIHRAAVQSLVTDGAAGVGADTPRGAFSLMPPALGKFYSRAVAAATTACFAALFNSHPSTTSSSAAAVVTLLLLLLKGFDL